jgi:hypothetical protein
MAQKEGLGVPISCSHTPAPKDDLSTAGLKKLRGEFRKRGLKSFQSHSLGILCLGDEVDGQYENTETEEESNSTDKSNDESDSSSLVESEGNSI